MSFVDGLQPKDTEELRTNFFVQKRGKNQRQVYPASWNGKILWKNLFFGRGLLKGLSFFLILMFIAWAYQNDTAEYRTFYEDVTMNTNEYCVKYYSQSEIVGSVGVLIPLQFAKDEIIKRGERVDDLLQPTT